MEHIGKKMQQLRKQKGLSLRELGSRLNIAHSHLSMIENGKKKPNLELLGAIAQIYDVSVSYLVGEEYSKEEKSFIADTPQLSLDDLLNKYKIVVGDREATKEEIQEAIKYILIKRQMDRTE